MLVLLVVLLVVSPLVYLPCLSCLLYLTGKMFDSEGWLVGVKEKNLRGFFHWGNRETKKSSAMLVLVSTIFVLK